MTSWAADGSLEALRSALRERVPELEAAEIVLNDRIEQTDERWWKGSAVIDRRFIVKYAWSQRTSAQLWHEVEVLTLLTAQPDLVGLPTVVAASSDPALLVTDLVASEPLTEVAVERATPAAISAMGDAIAHFLSLLHRPAVLEAVERALGAVGGPAPQATTDELRDGLAPWVGPDELVTILEWCDWVDEVQATWARRVLVHGDLHGHNQVWDLATNELRLVVDYEHTAAAEPELDLRYLATHGINPDLLLATADAYERYTGIRIDLARAIAWNVRSVLGDLLWRRRAGVPLPDTGTPEQWVRAIDAAMGEVPGAPRLPR